MFTQQTTPPELEIVVQRHTRFKSGFFITVAVTAVLTLGMIGAEMLLVALIFAAMGAYGSVLLFNIKSALEKDLGEGTVTVYQGPIEKRVVQKTWVELKEHLLFVDGKNHLVPANFYEGVDEGDTVELHFTRFSEVLTEARLICRKGMEHQADYGTYEAAPPPPPPAHDPYAAQPYEEPWDPTTAQALCEYCGYPLDARTGTCERCYPADEPTNPDA